MKLLLIIPIAIIELLLLAANWIVAFISPKAGLRMMEWNLHVMPDKEWYTGKEESQ